MSDILNQIFLSITSFIFGMFSFYIVERIKNHIEREKKLKEEKHILLNKYSEYAKKMFMTFSHLEKRLLDIISMNELESLRMIPSKSFSIEWYTKEGYYITSTSYLFAQISCLINQYQEEYKFINFSNMCESDKLNGLLKEYQSAVTSFGFMWFYYHIAIGEAIYDKKKNTPLSFFNYIQKLHQDSVFFDFMNQLFYFIKLLSESRELNFIEDMIKLINRIQTTLKDSVLFDNKWIIESSFDNSLWLQIHKKRLMP